MCDDDLQAVMTGLQEVLPVLDQAQDLLQKDSAQSRPTDTKGWSSTFNGRPKACCSLLPQVLLYKGPALQCTLCILDQALRSGIAVNKQ
jgi:hypothetical protein